jgi:glycosyltransferase involved in cell wall biosynthesis
MNLVTSKANPIWHFRRDTAGPRRIVHVPRRFASSHWTGSEATILELAQHQLTSGLDPVVITTLALSEVRHEIVKGIRVHRHPHSYPFLEAGGAPVPTRAAIEANFLAIPVFQSLLQELDVRLFHTHTLGRLGAEVRNAARMRARPFVASVHGHSIRIPTATSDGDPDAGHESSIEPGKSTGTFVMSRKELQDADMVIFASKCQADRASIMLEHDRVAHLPAGIECARFATGDGATFRASHQIPQDAFVIGSFCGLDAGKFKLLLEAFTRADTRRVRSHLLATISAAHAEDASQLNAMIQERGLGGHAHIIVESRGQSAERVHALHACDAVALLSRTEPSHPAVLEAWSAGRPVIAGSHEGPATLVKDGETGLLFEPHADDAAAQLATCIERLALDESLRNQLGGHGRQEVLTQHDWKRVAARLEEIYQLAERHHQAARQRGRKAA